MDVSDGKGAARGRVAVIALDGATWDLAKPWMEAGEMPHLRGVVEAGVHGGMAAELPPSSVPNWPAFMTGKNAGKHGCLWWLRRDREGWPDQLPIDSTSVDGGTIWGYLSQLGRRVLVQNVPVTYPPEPVEGVMISGLLTPRDAEDFAYPPDLRQEIDRLVDGYRIYPQGSYGQGRERAFLESLVANIHEHTATMAHLMESKAWDLAVLVLGPTDEGAHKYWHYSDPEHHMYDPKKAQEFGDSLKTIYRAADEAIGRLLERLSPEDTVIVLSDHGFGPVERFFLPNNWLIRRGHLRLKRTPRTLLKRALFRLGFTPRNIYPLGKQLLSLIPGSQGFRQRIDPARRGRSPLRRVFLSAEDIDWSRTTAYATGFLYAQVYINLEGREPMGTVAPQEYERVRAELARELAEIVDPQTGRPHYERIYVREELYEGPHLDQLPDLVCAVGDGRTVDSGIDFRSNQLFATDRSISGTHRREGIFAMRGPGVRRGAAIAPVRIFDFAPTILYCLDEAVPEDMDGRVVREAFAPNFLEQRPIRYTEREEEYRRIQEGYSSDEEAAVTDRLRDLGYLG